MNFELHLRDRLGERPLAEHELPFEIGGEGADLAVPGVGRDGVVAAIGVDEHGLYVSSKGRGEEEQGLSQSDTSLSLERERVRVRESGDRAALLNGQPLAGRSGLAHGDVLGVGDALIFFLMDGKRAWLQVEEAQHELTAPPLIEAGADEAADRGPDTQSIHRVAFKPVMRTETARATYRQPWRWALAAGIGLLAVALWFLTAAIPVRVLADPASAYIDFVDSRFKVSFGEHYLLLPGNYTLVASSPGFETLRQPVRVTDEANQQVQVRLRKRQAAIQEAKVQPKPVPSAAPEPQPIVGKLLVRTTPAGANVTIAGLYRGRTPLEIDLPPAPEYAIELHRAGYETVRRVSAVQEGERTSLDVSLKPVLGTVTVRGEPEDAQLFVDGEAKGAAGQTLSLPAAVVQLEVRREGYQTFTASVTPQPGFPRVVEYRLLTPEQVQAQRYPSVIKTKIGGELRLMPTGRFEMGSARREAGGRANESRRTVTLQRQFYLGTKEISNAEYLRFRSEHLSGVIKDRSLDQDTHPVVNVSWREAAEFCDWLSTQDGLTPAYEQQGESLVLISPATTGYRLPTEAEWEWAARHERGQAARRYPWGQALPVPPGAGNYADRSSLAVLEAALEGYDDGFPTTAPVGKFPSSPLGLFDMGGNVSEWMQDFYTVYRELDQSSATDPIGPASGTNHVIRGSNWKTASVTELRLAWREPFDGKAQHVGFRIARYAE